MTCNGHPRIFRRRVARSDALPRAPVGRTRQSECRGNPVHRRRAVRRQHLAASLTALQTLIAATLCDRSSCSPQSIDPRSSSSSYLIDLVSSDLPMLGCGGGERRGLPRVNGDAGYSAQPVSKDTEKYGHHHRDSDRWLAGQMHFLLQIDQPENDGRQPARAEPPHEHDSRPAQACADERDRHRQHAYHCQTESRV